MDLDALFSEGLHHHIEGRLAPAEKIYKEILRLCPSHAPSLHHLGLIFLRWGLIPQAISEIRSSLLCDASNWSVMADLGYCFFLIGDHAKASELCRAAVELNPENDTCWTNLGNAQRGLGLFTDARHSYENALALCPDDPRYLYNIGLTYFDQNQFNQAMEYFQRCLAGAPNITEAHNNLAACSLKLNDSLSALRHADRAISLKPDYAEAWSNRGNALGNLKRHEEALASYSRAIELKPDYAEAWSNRGNALSDLKRHSEALTNHDRAIELKPDYAEAWTNRAIALNDLKRHEEALANYNRAIELKPDYAGAWINRASGLNDLKRHEEALASYDRAIELKPDADYVLGSLVHTQMKICDWTDLDSRCQTLETRILTGDQASSPFPVLGLFDKPPLQRQCAEIEAKNKLGFTSPLGPIGKQRAKDKIRVGYFSMDFREHPVAHLVVEMIECHDRNKFEVYGISFGVNTADAMRRRLEGAFDKFYDVRHLSEIDIARLSRELEIDIAVDLGGFTLDSRPAIFAHRAAPVQINYLGFPGTMGTPVMDYLIADPVVIPTDSQSTYSEKIIYLPNSYQVNDSKRLISDRVFTRQEFGLPESGFVFCCFNNNWKIVPETLDTWVRIIQSAPNSTLWLYEDNPAARRNLIAEASKRGLDANRLVFAGHMSHAEHLARYRLADLFLDTFPYGAHTTASDALWAGLPVLTRPGKSFPSRVASSLLRSIGLPELITCSVGEYESLAVELANNPERIAAIKKRLADNQGSYPLFNTPLFTRHIESAYRAASDRFQDGFPPDHIYVTA